MCVCVIGKDLVKQNRGLVLNSIQMNTMIVDVCFVVLFLLVIILDMFNVHFV